jgi:alpha-L-rhamnosidase
MACFTLKIALAVALLACGIRPHLNGVPWVKATVPHTQGEIRLEMKRSGTAGLEALVLLPEGVGGWFDWNGQKVALHGGRQTVRFSE